MSRSFITGQMPDSLLRCFPQAAKQAIGNAGLTFAEADAKRLDVAEVKLQNMIADFLRMLGYAFNRSRMDRRKTDKTGWPDFTFGVKIDGLGLARAVALEVKVAGRMPTAEQSRVMAELERDGWYVGVVYSVDDVRRAIEEARAITKPAGNYNQNCVEAEAGM